MSAVQNLVVTNSGAALLDLMKTKVGTFTKLVIGDGYNVEDFKTVENMVNPLFEIEISSYDKDSASGVVTLNAEFDNTVYNKGFWYRELGLYAKDPDTSEEILFAYGNANEYAEYIVCAESEKATIRKSIVVAISVANTDNVDVIINPDYSIYQKISEKGEAGGYASLDDTGKVPQEQLPESSIGADVALSNIVNTGLSQYNPFCVNTGVTADDGSPACITVEDNILTTSGTFSCSAASGAIFTISDTLTLNLSSYDDGKYNIFIDPDVPELYLMQNTVYSGTSMPSGAVTGDYLLNTSKVPYSLDVKTDDGVEPCIAPNAVYTGVLTISGGGN